MYRKNSFIKKFLFGSFIFLIAAGTLLLTYALYEPLTLYVKQYNIAAPAFSGLKIVFAGDFHVGPKDMDRLDNIILEINRQKPDLIILGGDYTKGHEKHSSMPIEKIARKFSELEAPYGIYAVLGNHDNWYGKKEVMAALTKHHIQVLDNESREIHFQGQILTLVGVSDFLTDTVDFVKAFENVTGEIILITHSPDVFPNSPQTLLILAAHTHGGQINLPIIGAPVIPSKYGQHYGKGMIQEKQRKMIVTQGLGTSILPIRINCPPEIVSLTFQ